LFLFPANSFSFAEIRQQQAQELLQQRDAVLSATTTTIVAVKQNLSLDQNMPDFKYNYSNSSSRVLNSELGIEPTNNNNWITVNHDIYGTRSSNQTIINKDNVNGLQIKWKLINDFEIPDPPIIVGNKGYVQDYAGTVIAFDADNGKILWKDHIGNGPTMGLTFDNGIVFAAAAYNASVAAINATDGRTIWQSLPLGDTKVGYDVSSPPIVWKGYVIAGSAGSGGQGTGVGLVRGNITALNATNGKIIWNLPTTAGDWVEPRKAPPYNSGATAWSGGALDPETGIIYIPLGSPSPNFNATTRQTPNLYANHMIAVNVTNGKLLWATPFIDYGTVLNVRVPDTHDWDTSWGSTVSKVTFDNGTQKKLVIGHDKMGNVMAMDASTGKPIWWKTLGKQYNTNAIPSANGSGMIWTYGIFNYHAVDDNNTLYIAATNRGLNYFTNGIYGDKKAAPHTIEQGLGNGTIAAMDVRTGKIKWEYQVQFPPIVSPLITNGMVFTGYIPFTEKSITTNHTTTVRSGVILALDKETGVKLWEFDVNAQIGQVGPSIGDGMLFVPTGHSKDNGVKVGGSIVAFGLP
jgi:outer membrane protein assembly factor BamB